MTDHRHFHLDATAPALRVVFTAPDGTEHTMGESLLRASARSGSSLLVPHWVALRALDWLRAEREWQGENAR